MYIPPVAPQGYTDGFADVPAAWGESSETAAYGTYHVTEADRARFVEEVNFPGKTGPASTTSSQPTAAKIDLATDRPWSLKITPEGIIVEDIAASSVPIGGVVTAEIVKKRPPAVTGEHAYQILSSLASKPRSIDGIKQNVPVDDVELFALLAALTQAKLIVRGTTSAGMTAFALTPLGRKLGRRFLEGGAKAKPEELPEKSAGAKPPVTRRFFARKIATTSTATPPPEVESSTASTVKPLVVSSPTGEKVVLDESGKVMMVGHPGPPATTPTSPQLSKGTHVQFEGTIGSERKEEKPFDDEIKAEDVNPNVQHLDPKLLQPMEMRITQDRGSDVRESDTSKDTDAHAKELMDKAEQFRKKRKSKFGSEQAPKPQEGVTVKAHVPCPKCRTLVELGARNCQVCGSSLALEWKAVSNENSDAPTNEHVGEAEQLGKKNESKFGSEQAPKPKEKDEQ
jgi:hypothetical protein